MIKKALNIANSVSEWIASSFVYVLIVQEFEDDRATWFGWFRRRFWMSILLPCFGLPVAALQFLPEVVAVPLFFVVGPFCLWCALRSWFLVCKKERKAAADYGSGILLLNESGFLFRAIGFFSAMIAYNLFFVCAGGLFLWVMGEADAIPEAFNWGKVAIGFLTANSSFFAYFAVEQAIRGFIKEPAAAI